MTTPHQLKSKKKFNAPALFVNPQSILDAEALRKTISDYPSETAYIEGIVVSLKDLEQVIIGLQQSALFNANEIIGRIRIIDPAFNTIFQGYSASKDALMNVEIDNKKKVGDYQLIAGGLRLRDVVARIGTVDKNKIKEKADRYINEIYPYMDILVSPIMKNSIDKRSDMVIVPCVPITNSLLISRQVEQARKMNRAGKILAETLFAKEMENRDLMFMLTVNMSVIRQENYDEMISTLIIHDNDQIIFPDQIGIRLENEDNSNVEATQSFLDFIARLARTLKNYNKEIPIHLFNVRESGYVAFCYGATTITSPIATPPSIKRSTTGGYVTDMGKYYHPTHMLDYRYEKLLALTRIEYILPCHCKVCEREKNLLKVRDNWNQFRREHFLLVKHIEMKEIKEAPSSVLNRHIQQKFSRSKQTVWLAFLDQQPILTFN